MKEKLPSIKCMFASCLRMIGPIRQERMKRERKPMQCSVCERNLDEWEKRSKGKDGLERRLEWRRRVRMFGERLDALGGTPDSKVVQFIRREVKRRNSQ